MKQVDETVLEKHKVVRIHYHMRYIYAVIKIANGYATVSSYEGYNWTMSPIGKIDEDKLKKQLNSDFVNTHALVHISNSRGRAIKSWL